MPAKVTTLSTWKVELPLRGGSTITVTGSKEAPNTFLLRLTLPSSEDYREVTLTPKEWLELISAVPVEVAEQTNPEPERCS